MKWHLAVEALLKRLREDPELVATLGGPRIYRANEYSGEVIPAVFHTIVVRSEDEVYEPFVWQLGWFASVAQGLVIERRIRALATAKTHRRIEGLTMKLMFGQAREHPDPKPGVAHSTMDIRVEVVRDR